MTGILSKNNPVGRKQFIALLWLLWFLAVLVVYYKQVWNAMAQWITTGTIPAEIVSLAWELMKAGLSFLLVGLPLVCLLYLLAPNRNLQQQSAVHKAAVMFLTMLAVMAGAGFFLFTPPFLGEAMSRLLQALSGAGAVVLAAYLAGRGICRIATWQFPHWREALLFRTSLGLIALSVCSLILAGVGAYTVYNVRLLVLAVLLTGLVWYVKSYDPEKSIRSQIRRANFFRFDSLRQAALAAVFLLTLSIAFIAALAPETEFDALSYHLTFPKLWLQNGVLTDQPERYVSLYPMSWGLLFGLGLALGGTVAAKLLHFICLPLTCLLVFQFVRRFLPQASAWLAVCLFATVPTVLWEASTAYIDLALALHLALALYALFQFVEKEQWKWIVLAGLNLGMTLASKHLSLFFLALSASGLAVLFWIRKRNFVDGLKPALVLFLISFALPLPWYIRSYLLSGNPVFPELFTLFGAPPNRWDAKTAAGLSNFLNSFGRPRTLPNLLTLPWDMTIHAARYGGTLGPLFLALLPPFLLLYRLSRTVVYLIVFVTGYLLLWASPFSSFQLRFVLPVTPLLAILAAEAFRIFSKQLESLLQNTARYVFWLLLCLLIGNLPPFTPFHETNKHAWSGWLSHVQRQIPLSVVMGKETEDRYISRLVPSYRAWRYINAHTGPGAKILSFSDGDYYYSERSRLWCYATVARRVVWETAPGQEQQSFQALQKMGISHILFDKQLLRSLQPGELVLANPTFLNWYKREYEDEQFVLYRLLPLRGR